MTLIFPERNVFQVHQMIEDSVEPETRSRIYSEGIVHRLRKSDSQKMMLLILVFALMLSQPSQPGESLDDAIQRFQKGEFKQAITLLMQLRDSSPSDPNIRLWLGKSYLKARDWDSAIREMEKSVQLQPSSARNYLWLGRACGGKAAHVFPLLAARWARRVLKEFETARKLSPEDLDTRFDLLEFYLEAPGIMGGGKDKANAEAQAIAKLDPRKGYAARSAIFSKDKKWDLAKKELIQATVDFPNDADAYKDLAEFLLSRKDFNGALQHAGKARVLNKGSKGIQLLVAAASIQLRADLDDSEQVLKNLASGSLADSDPSFEDVYYWLGECYLAKGDTSKALGAFKTVLSFNPEHEKAKEHISAIRN
jgi:tetratricopeptide (TPR) repeat protein